MEKSSYLLGEPIFCTFVIRNTGSRVFAFRYRSPSRVLIRDYEQEPSFQVTGRGGRKLPDPAPRPCGGTQGTVVYGSVTLPPGQTESERWLLNEWARFTGPGRFQVRAERRLALLEIDPKSGKFSEKPAAFALALEEISFELQPSTPAQVAAAFQPYLAQINNTKDRDPAEAVLVVTTLPQSFFFQQLVDMANPVKPDRWDRRDALAGLARLGTPEAWRAILKLASGDEPPAPSARTESKDQAEDPVRSYAVLLLAEKADPAFLSTLIEMLRTSAEPLRGEVLRALGFFSDARAYQTLFANLHSAATADRMNSILGLKNLGTKEVIPALLAMLNDPEPQVRQVADFALGGVTGHKTGLSTEPSRAGSARLADAWHAWWREHGGSFSPPHPAACHEW
jgi:HEAT repeat protein